MSGPFKLRSGNVTPFKQMGSSPTKQPENGEGFEESLTEEERKIASQEGLESIIQQEGEEPVFQPLPAEPIFPGELVKAPSIGAQEIPIEPEELEPVQDEIPIEEEEEEEEELLTRGDVIRARKAMKSRKKQSKRKSKIERYKSKYQD